MPAETEKRRRGRGRSSRRSKRARLNREDLVVSHETSPRTRPHLGGCSVDARREWRPGLGPGGLRQRPVPVVGRARDDGFGGAAAITGVGSPVRGWLREAKAFFLFLLECGCVARKSSGYFSPDVASLGLVVV